MIQNPRRSVTRFFIPLIDVLILLFCIFLLMPYVKKGASKNAPTQGEVELKRLRIDRLEREVKSLQESKGSPGKVQDLEEKIRQLEAERDRRPVDNRKTRSLRIDPKTGVLWTFDPERVEIRTQEDALALIDRDRKEDEGTGKKRYYLILYPEEASLHPLVEEQARYSRWFRAVPLEWESPYKRTEGGKKP
jgi:hypothetical protein